MILIPVNCFLLLIVMHVQRLRVTYTLFVQLISINRMRSNKRNCLYAGSIQRAHRYRQGPLQLHHSKATQLLWITVTTCAVFRGWSALIHKYRRFVFFCFLRSLALAFICVHRIVYNVYYIRPRCIFIPQQHPSHTRLKPPPVTHPHTHLHLLIQPFIIIVVCALAPYALAGSNVNYLYIPRARVAHTQTRAYNKKSVSGMNAIF